MAQRGVTFEPTDEQRKRVEVWTCARVSKEEIARRLGIDPKTLHVHFNDELANGEARVEGDHLMALHNEIVEKGNVAAYKEFYRQKKLAGWMPTEAAPKPAKLGKKELQKQLAQNPDPSNTLGEWMVKRAERTAH